MDVIALAQHGITNATATLGTATSKTHLERIYRLCPKWCSALTATRPGARPPSGRWRPPCPCMEDGRQARFLFLPEGEDPDTMVRAAAPSTSRTCWPASRWKSFLFESVAEGWTSATMDGRARLSKLALPLIRQLPEGVYRQLMFQALAERTGLELASLMQLETPHHRRNRRAPPDYDDAPHFDDAPGRAGPSARQRGKRRSAGYSNLAQAAIALLLHQTGYRPPGRPRALSELQGEEWTCCGSCWTCCTRRPESNTAMLLGTGTARRKATC